MESDRTSRRQMETNGSGFYFRTADGVVSRLLFDTVYHLEHVIPHTNDSAWISFAFTSPENSLGDESWGLDNVFVGIPTPEEVPAPGIQAPPNALEIPAGSSALSTVVADGGRPMTYQWRRDGVPIPAGTIATLRWAPASSADEGEFDVVVQNAGGAATSLSSRTGGFSRVSRDRACGWTRPTRM